MECRLFKTKRIFQIHFQDFFKVDNSKYYFMTQYLSYDDINSIKIIEQKDLNK